MNETLRMEYTVTPRLLLRAMTAWHPRPRLRTRLLRIALIVVAAVVTGTVLAVTGVFRMMPDGFWTGIFVGFYAGLAFWFVVQRVQAKKIGGFAADLLERQGITRAALSDAGAEFTTDVGRSHTDWPAVDQVITMSDATGLRIGALIHPLPDAALPDGITPDTFRARLMGWIEAAR